MKLLLAVDGSENSTLSIKFLKRTSAFSGANVEVVSVVSPEIPLGVPAIEFGAAFTKQARLNGQKAIDQAVEMLAGSDFKTSGTLLEGHAAAMIVDHAQQIKADLVVLGAQGHSLLSRMLLGSVSDYVATHVGCSVLVIRDSEYLQSNSSLRVCVGYDDSKPSLDSLKQLSDFGLLTEASVEMVSVVVLPVDTYSDIPLPFDPQEVVAANEQLVAKAVKLASEQFGSRIDGAVEQSVNVGLGLVQFVERDKSDLLVVGDTGRGFMSRFLLGSVSRNVLRHAPCSVLITRCK